MACAIINIEVMGLFLALISFFIHFKKGVFGKRKMHKTENVYVATRIPAFFPTLAEKPWILLIDDCRH